jgi:hypothetical protein
MRKEISLILFFLFNTILLSAHPGIGIVMDSKGNVFYTDLVHVWKITPEGQHEIAVKDVHTHQLFVDEKDNLFGEHSWYEGEATDKWGYNIWKLDPKGNFQKIVPDTEGFPTNNQLVRDCEGSQFWSEEERTILKKKTSDGVLTTHATGFKDIRWICIPEGSLDVFVVDFTSLKRVRPNGRVELISDDLIETKLSHTFLNDRHKLMGVWMDKDQNIYSSVYSARMVKKITPEGKISTFIESEKTWSPTGGLFDSDGNLWLLEYSLRNKARVRKIGNNGKETLFE